MAIRFEQWEEEFQRGLRRERIVRDRLDPFLYYDDVELYARFRFCRAEYYIYLFIIKSAIK